MNPFVRRRRPKNGNSANNCEIYGPGFLQLRSKSIGQVGKLLGKHLRLAHKSGVLDSRGRRVITIGGRNGLTPGSSIEKLQNFFTKLFVHTLVILIVVKLFMLKVCIQSVHHGGIKFAIAF